MPSRLARLQVIVQTRPKVPTVVQIIRIGDIRTKETIHPDRVRIATIILDRTETGDQIQWTCNTGNRFENKDREPRHPVGITVPRKMTDHLQERLILGPKAKRTVHPGVKVVMSVGKENVMLLTIVVLWTKRDHRLILVLLQLGTLWRDSKAGSVPDLDILVVTLVDQDCYSTFHANPPRNVPQRPSFSAQNNPSRRPARGEDQSNWQQSPRQGDRPPQDDSIPSPRSNYHPNGCKF